MHVPTSRSCWKATLIDRIYLWSVLCSSEDILLLGSPSTAFLFASYLWDSELDTLTTVYSPSDQPTSSAKAQGPIYKFLGIHIPDICQRLSFNPLCELIRADQQVSLISRHLGERAYNVQALLSEWPRAGQRIKDFPWLVDVWCESLTLVALPHIFLCFFLQVWPPIALSDGSVRQQSAPVWLPQIPSCNSSRSNSAASGCMHSRYGPEKECLYSFWSSDSQNWGAFLCTLSASNLFSGKTSSFRNNTIESI